MTPPIEVQRRGAANLAEVSPERMANRMAAPYAAASSGLMLLLGSFHLDTSLTIQGIWGRTGFIDLGIPEDLLDRFQGASEEGLAELLEAGWVSEV